MSRFQHRLIITFIDNSNALADRRWAERRRTMKLLMEKRQNVVTLLKMNEAIFLGDNNFEGFFGFGWDVNIERLKNERNRVIIGDRHPRRKEIIIQKSELLQA